MGSWAWRYQLLGRQLGWFSNWWPITCDICLTVREALPDLEDLRTHIPDPLLRKIQEIKLSPQVEDHLVFSISENGKFSSKLYIDYSRPRGYKRSWTSLIWHNNLPPKVTTFLWKLIRHALPVDIRIRMKGIQLVSKSRCCTTPDEESISHLFLHSRIAREVWRCFGVIFRLPLSFASIGKLIKLWMPKVRGLSQFELCKAGVAMFGFWEIWVAWCAATFEGEQMNAIRICLKIITRVQLHSLVHPPRKTSSRIQGHILGILGIQTKARSMKKKRVWKPPIQS